jgi:hypothetical protein
VVLESRKRGLSLTHAACLKRIMLYIVHMRQHPSCNQRKGIDVCQFRCSWKWSKTENCQLGSCVDITSHDLRNPSFSLKYHKHSDTHKTEFSSVKTTFSSGRYLRPCRSHKNRNSLFQNSTVAGYIALFLLLILPEIRYRWQAVCNSA